jgi:hypothetical protein
VRDVLPRLIRNHDLPSARSITEQLRRLHSIFSGIFLGIDRPESLAFAIDLPRTTALDDDI